MAQDAQRGEILYDDNNCMMCHGNNGQGVPSENGPRIGGQHDWYILTSLNNFKAKVRSNPAMYPYIKSLSEQDFKDLAAFVPTLTGMEE
jgi:cytochrome c553